MTIAFVDLKVRDASLRSELLAAMQRVADGARFVLGPDVADFEQAFAGYCGAAHCIGVANGTDALHLTLRALGVGPGDEVITAANTFIATALAIEYTGATPVLVDVNANDYLLDVELLESAITRRTKAIIPVHLYGQPADMPAILAIAEKYDLAVVQDACQAHGAQIDGAPLGRFGTAACYSFYPSKNLGAFGDGGAVVTGDDTLADRVRLLRNYCQHTKHQYLSVGYNSRLDTLQAAILAVKLRYLDGANQLRRAAAARYRELLQGTDVILPTECGDGMHVYHLYVVHHERRDALMAHLQAAGVQCGVHYPEPIHHTRPFRWVRTVPEGAPVSSRLAKRILSLPMFPGISDDEIDRVAQEVSAFDTKLAVL
jgi:dTDP-4-amino-4,6-dideoxygalactose transaminase